MRRPAACVLPVFMARSSPEGRATAIQLYSPAGKWTKIGADCFAYRIHRVKTRLLKGSVAGVLGIALLYSAGAYWTGLEAERTLARQHDMIAGLPIFKVKSHQYERGWFSSTETTELTFNERFFAPYLGILPDAAKNALSGTVKYVNHVQHGPLPGGLRPARAVVTTEFIMSPDTRKMLSRFFGDKEPITVVNRLNFTGGGELNVSVPAFDYEETLAGVKIKWQGMTTQVGYDSDYSQYSIDARLPGLVLDAATKGHVEFSNLSYLSDTRPGATGAGVGNKELSVTRVKLESKENIPYQIKLNELISLLTRIRIGEFINPAGEIKPSQADLVNLKYQIVSSEENQFINARAKFGFEKLEVNHTAYGPMRLDLSVNHLHGPSLLKLEQAFSDIQVEGVEPDKLRQQYIDAVVREGGPILENNPRLAINDFSLKLPSGEMTLTGNVALNGYQKSDLDSSRAFLNKLTANVRLSVPRDTLQGLVVAQARNLFTVDATAENPPSLQEIDELARNLFASQIDIWAEQGYLQQEGGQIKTSAEWKNSQLTINSRPVALPEPAAAPASADKP